MATEADKYRLTFTSFYENGGRPAGNGLTPVSDIPNDLNGAAFSTYDVDNDQSGGDCAGDQAAGWWYNDCAVSNLNGIFSNYTGGPRDTSIPSLVWGTNLAGYNLLNANIKVRATSTYNG